jgi:hypothetical protein
VQDLMSMCCMLLEASSYTDLEVGEAHRDLPNPALEQDMQNVP